MSILLTLISTKCKTEHYKWSLPEMTIKLMYNMLFDSNPDCDKLLSLLGKTKYDFGSFCDVYMSYGYIIVYTRNGGNRDHYQDVFDEMMQHPWYAHDEDETFDNTYASIYFKIPEMNRVFIELMNLNPGKTPTDNWVEFFNDI